MNPRSTPQPTKPAQHAPVRSASFLGYVLLAMGLAVCDRGFSHGNLPLEVSGVGFVLTAAAIYWLLGNRA